MTGCPEVGPGGFVDRYERVVAVDEIAGEEQVLVPATAQMVICQEIPEES